METGKRLILHTETADVGSVAAGGEVDTAITVVGAEPGHVAMVSAPALEAGLVASAMITDVNEVTVRVSNVSAAPVDPASQAYIIAVTQD